MTGRSSAIRIDRQTHRARLCSIDRLSDSVRQTVISGVCQMSGRLQFAAIPKCASVFRLQPQIARPGRWMMTDCSVKLY